MDLLGDVVFNFYGATETGIVTLASPADLRAAPGTIGPLLGETTSSCSTSSKKVQTARSASST